MTETDSATKFRTVFIKREPPSHRQIPELMNWCYRLARLGVTPGVAGNMSFRSTHGFIITRAAAELAVVTESEVVEVLKTDLIQREMTVAGAYEPSSETPMHAGFYQVASQSRRINAVFHAHSPELLAAAERLGVPVTEREQPYGTPELVAEVLKTLDDQNFLVMRNHGFVSVGKTMTEAGELIEQILTRL